MTVTCPDCDHEIHLGSNPEVGDLITCPECWAHLEIFSLDPLEVDWHIEKELADDREEG